jgi:hypothetical protein
LESKEPISQRELLERLQPLLVDQGQFYRKVQPVLARQADQTETVATVTRDGLETVNRAKPGDFIVQNMTEAGEKYVVDADKFDGKYEYIGPEKDGWHKYQPNGRVLAVELSKDCLEHLCMPEEFEFMTAWNEKMVAKAGDFLACPPDCSEVYRIARQEFFETYRPEEKS